MVKLAGEKSIPFGGKACTKALGLERIAFPPPPPRNSIISEAESKRELEDGARGNVVRMRFSRQE